MPDFSAAGRLYGTMPENASIRSDLGIFCCATGTACGTTGPNCDATVDGSGPNKVGTRCPGAKYGLYVLAGMPVK